jgi:hypothetical protein
VYLHATCARGDEGPWYWIGRAPRRKGLVNTVVKRRAEEYMCSFYVPNGICLVLIADISFHATQMQAVDSVLGNVASLSLLFLAFVFLLRVFDT